MQDKETETADMLGSIARSYTLGRNIIFMELISLGSVSYHPFQNNRR